MDGMRMAFVFALIAAGCGGGDRGPAAAACAPGAQVECACPGGAKGAQACDDDGGGYGACRCGGAATGGAGATGMGGAPPSACNPSTCKAPTNADAVCSGNLCSWSCQDGYADCDGNPANGCEVDITTIANCGKCGVKCAPSVGVCVARHCEG